jgi:5-methylthioadenosine/S-adenosylhomocysteine deaminase
VRTTIHGGWVVGYDANANSHYLLEEGTVVIDGAKIAYVGTDDAGRVDRTIDARGKLVSPGFVNTHVHAGIEGTSRSAPTWSSG